MVDCTGLENRQGVKAFGGSNPSSSAGNPKADYLSGWLLVSYGIPSNERCRHGCRKA